MSILPDDIRYEILSRLPVKSLLRFRVISRFWLTLIDSPNFIKSHLKQSVKTKNNLYLILSYYNPGLFDFSRLCRMDLDSVEALEGDGILQLVEINGNPMRHHRYNNRIWGTCDGLLCLSNKKQATLSWNPSTRIIVGPVNHSNIHQNDRSICVMIKAYIDIVVVWNPSTKKFVELPFASIEIKDYDPKYSHVHQNRAYGFGYDNTNDDYKVVRVAVVQDVVRNYEVKVYSLRSNSWHTADKFPNQDPKFNGVRNSVAGGAMHWFSVDADLNSSIIAFDLGLETYRVIQLPVCRDLEFYVYLTSFGGCLSLTCHHYSGHVDTWLLKQYGEANESWSRFIILAEQNIPDMSDYFVRCIAYSKNGKKVLLEMGLNLFWYNLEMGSLEDLMIIHSVEDSLEDIVSCLESLVSVDVAEAG
ncbi:F-box protein CPR1-like [Impatiens glandulifera]|uniref:F-box protein CPR1-like n=1 Tax=Impatiens glandulifera TaxID=253017 RepID=UPI001FB19F1B|nr:F-box protein CPR1-like [Impatiens glandulifera]